eukprot:NODE_6958_length_482_cov_101.540845_g6792_i0.p1 GENE.NODE_6958_length_482_cov_101.540845_g6792_i0~~NODE_6958_length_482_cov_101.540845_g6792_i0.p1  ORF type:complete len:132 (+),score=34.69 NODE_6958_length_482_cov_101.540845_g6792_i0:54-449(+)
MPELADDCSSSSEDGFENYKPQSDGEPNAFEATRNTEGTGYDALAQHEDRLLGDVCIICFKLPDGSQHRHEEFRMGHTVEWLKQAVEDKHNIPYHSQQLFFNDKLMIDPLSLSDIPNLKTGEANHVLVKVQ